MADEKRALPDGEHLIWQGRPDWRAFAGLTILGFVTAPIVVGIVLLLVLGVRKRSVSWMVTDRRIEVEKGWLSRRIDTVELARVKDVEYRQGLWDRMAGVTTIVVRSHDQKFPTVELRGLPGTREVFDQLSNAVMAAHRRNPVVEIEPS